jgi:hypothetical protein
MRPCAQLDDEDDRVGMLAMFHHNDAIRTSRSSRPTAASRTSSCTSADAVREFGMARRATWERPGLLRRTVLPVRRGSDFSLKVWHAGLRVEPAWTAFVDHR